MRRVLGELKDFKKRVGFASVGIINAFRRERNLQIQSVIGLLVIIIAALIHVSLLDFMILLVLIACVLSLELVNTAIERTVDMIKPDYHPLAKQAKDIAAGAVLLFSIFSVMIGVIILYRTFFL